MITKSQPFAKTSPPLSLPIVFSLKIDKKQPQWPSEILATLLSCHQEFLLDYMGWRRTLCLEGNPETVKSTIRGSASFCDQL